MNFLTRKFNAILRYVLVYNCSALIPNIIVTEYPRTGGSWLSLMLSDYFNIPFPASKLPPLKKSVIHGHYLYKKSMKNTIVLIRDVRDVVVSYYFFTFYFSRERQSQLYKKMNKLMSFNDYENVEKNLPEYIEKLFKHKIYPRFNWNEFVFSFYEKPNLYFVKYEKLKSNGVKTFKKIVESLGESDIDEKRIEYIFEKRSFKKMAKTHQGKDPKKSFLRKGKTGDWKNYFNKESAELINHYAGEGLRLMNYENDNKWIEDFIKGKNK